MSGGHTAGNATSIQPTSELRIIQPGGRVIDARPYVATGKEAIGRHNLWYDGVYAYGYSVAELPNRSVRNATSSQPTLELRIIQPGGRVINARPYVATGKEAIGRHNLWYDGVYAYGYSVAELPNRSVRNATSSQPTLESSREGRVIDARSYVATGKEAIGRHNLWYDGVYAYGYK